MAIVSLDEAKQHLRYTGTAHDLELQPMLDAATAAILGYCGNGNAYWQPIVDTWVDATTTPDPVRQAILLQVAEFDRFRGDTDPSAAREPAIGDVQPAIATLLRGYRDPVLA